MTDTDAITSLNGHVPRESYSDGEVIDEPVRRRETRKKEFRHAYSEMLPDVEVDDKRRSQAMIEVKAHAFNRLQEELQKAQKELKLKDEECEKLLKVRDQIGVELEDLTASLFEEANKMVEDANIKRIHAEKLCSEANHQVEVLQAEVAALKQLVLTSTPSSPNKHLNPQIDSGNGEKEKKEKKSLKPFWRTHRRSTSHHQFTKEDRLEAEAHSEARNDRCKEIDQVCFEEFKSWRRNPNFSRDSPFISRIAAEDICTCLNFTNTQLAEKVLTCVENNTLAIEPIVGDTNSFPRKCYLSETAVLCKYKVKLGEGQEWYSISEHCRNRKHTFSIVVKSPLDEVILTDINNMFLGIAAVCDFFTYVRYIQQGLVKSEDQETFYEMVRLRKQMALSRLGYV